MSLRDHFRRACCAPSRRLYNLQALFVVSLLLLSVCVTSDTDAQYKKTAPAIEIAFPNYSSAVTLTSLRQLDLKNSKLIIFGENGAPDFRAHLRRGAYEKRNKIGGDSIGFEWIKFIGNGSAEPEYAIAYYIWAMWAGSSSGFGVVQLLHIEDGKLKVVQQILFNMRGSEKAGAFFNAKSNTLTIRGVNDWEHCCPTGLDIVQFQLNDGVLKQAHYRKAPFQ